MKLISILLFLTILTQWGFPGTKKELNHLEFKTKFLKKAVDIDAGFRFPLLEVDESGIYIIDQKRCEIHVFNAKDGKELRVIGGRGEGPKEFLNISKLYFSRDLIYVSSPPRLSIFSKDGKLVKEQRTTYMDVGEFIPLGKNFIARRFIYEKKGSRIAAYFGYSLLDQNLKEIKSIFKTPYHKPTPKHKNKPLFVVFRHCSKGVVYKDRFYIGNTELGFHFEVFDSQGNKSHEINEDYDKISIDHRVKQTIIASIKARDLDNRFLSSREVFFPDYFPAFINFFITEDKIFVFKFPKPGQKGQSEVIVLDLKGNTLAKNVLPLGGISESLQRYEAISFYNGSIYFLDDFDENISIFKLSLNDLYDYYFK